MTAPPPRPLIPDFDSDPERFAANQAATQQFSAGGDVHQQVADRIGALDAGRVLDLGGGDGTLARLLARHDVPTVVLDRAGYVRSAPPPAVQADAARLPFVDGCLAPSQHSGCSTTCPNPSSSSPRLHVYCGPVAYL